MEFIILIFKIAGSLGLFLYGMKLLSDGLQKSAGARLKSILGLMTANSFMAVLTGLIITLLIQSSSATTVMVVSFVNASLMNLTQAIGVILGANIGTTVTGWIVALLGFKMDITFLSLISIAISLPMLFSSKLKSKNLAEIFLGFGILFIGLTFLQDSMPAINENPSLFEFFARFNDPSIFSLLVNVLIGTGITIIVQSSSASMAITITMAFQGWIGLYAACAMCLGQNIGTTITAYLASIGASTNARRASWAHILFNIIGSFIAILLFTPLLHLVNFIFPADIFAVQGEELSELLPTFLALFHTAFNVTNTVLFFFFINKFATLINKIVKEKKTYKDETYHFEYLTSNIIETPEIYLLTIKGEITKMSKMAEEMYSTYLSLSHKTPNIDEVIQSLKKKEDYADQMQEQLTTFLILMQQKSITPSLIGTVSEYLRVIDELESITDTIYTLSKTTQERIQEGSKLADEAKKDVKALSELVSSFLTYISTHIDNNLSEDNLAFAKSLEQSIKKKHNTVVKRIHTRMQTTENIQIELLLLDIERNLQHISKYCINIAECLSNVKSHAPSLQDV